MENQINEQTMLSLYDFLGNPAGSKLGAQVWNAAKKLNIPIQQRQITTKKYNGKVLLYPKYFLDQYFNKKQTNDLSF